MAHHGFVRVAAAVPDLRVADCRHNVAAILALLRQAQERDVELAVFPELCLTGYTCGDLFQQPVLLDAARDALFALAESSRGIYGGTAIVGLPFALGNRLFNVAAVLQGGKVLGLVPKSFLPNYREFYERRWFASGLDMPTEMLSDDIAFGTGQLFTCADFTLGVEVCEDLWAPIPPSSFQALAGATILVNLSASNDVLGKAAYRKQLVVNQSGRCLAGYVYVSCSPSESSTDVVFGGHALIAENGALLAESRQLDPGESLLISEIDVARMAQERRNMTTFADTQAVRRGQEPIFIHRPLTSSQARELALIRPIDAHPFVPRASEELAERCREIFQIQVAGLAERLEHIGRPPLSLGLSGGLDSTLALLVACKTLDRLKLPRGHLRALTMPGFGTTQRTLANARDLIQHLGVSGREIDIRALCLEEMRALEHRPFGIDLAGLAVEQFSAKLRAVPAEKCQDLVFENVQARMRMNLLMNQGFVVGTGDLSELALGWCTYGGDHMSMYNPNVSIPKTLVKFLVRWVADNEFAGAARATLHDVANTHISPELLPTGEDGGVTQKTENILGPYELHDFFLFHFLRYGAPPEKILYLARQARFDADYPPDELSRWLQVFLTRFFAQQYKRSCLPDGPKVGTISLSPRGDWRMPSDAAARLWVERSCKS